jgi:vacuolar-type H+-ATPase subunit E/Vma4
MKRRIQEELRGHYQAEVSKAVERAKKEAKREHKKHLEELERFHEQDLEEARAGLRREFDSEKDEVLYRLRVEMHRHQLELNRLKGIMEKLGGGGGELEEKEGELAKLGDGGQLQEKEGVQQEEGSC